MRILESILDDINSNDDVKRPLVNTDDDSVLSTQFDFILYIGHQTANKGNEEERQKEIQRRFTPLFEELKEKMNVFLSSYYTDNILYFEEDEDYISYKGIKRLPDDELKSVKTAIGGQGFYKIYFNFNSRVSDMLFFFYIIANQFNVWGAYSMQKIFAASNKKRLDFEIRYFYRNFLPKFRWSDDYTKRVRNRIIENKPYYVNSLLKLPDTPEELDKKIERFVTKIQVLDDWCQRNE